MAITIETAASASQVNPAYNEIIYVCSSTNVAQLGFKYLVDIYLDGVKVSRRRVSAEPVNNKLIVDVSSIIENFITSHDGVYPLSTNPIISGEESCKDFVVKFGEEYLVATVRTQFPDLVTDTFRAYNCAYNYTEWVNSSGSNTGVLTDKPAIAYKSGYYGAGHSSIVLASGATLTSYTIQTYSAGVLQNTYVVPLGAVGAKTAYHFATGFDSINLINSVLITGAPAQPILTTAIDRYDIAITTSVGTTLPIINNLVDRCEENESDRLHFLNRFGGFDTFDFTLLGTTSAQMEKKTMRRAVNRLTSAGVATASTQDRGLTTYNSTFDRVDKLSSNWITEDESNWLVDLLASPKVILERNGLFVSVVIEDTNYDFKTEQKDQLFKIDVTIKHSIKENRQRG